MSEGVILLATFLSVALIVLTVGTVLARSRAISKNIDEATSTQGGLRTVDEILSTDNEAVTHYLAVQRRAKPGSNEMRLIAAGFFGKSTPRLYLIIRFTVSVLTFLLTQVLLDRLGVGGTTSIGFVMSVAVGGAAFILCSAVLDYLISKVEIDNRKLFPDFMDLLIVCVDAGLSIEAAIDRVAREFIQTKPTFGTQLAIISLEIRAGRPLHEALTNFAERIRLDEARTLATLFRQSQELGSSVVKTLRVYSREMRTVRIVRAEEKANALPIKLLFPLAAFLFPVNLIIVLVPIMMLLLETFTQMGPPGM